MGPKLRHPTGRQAHMPCPAQARRLCSLNSTLEVAPVSFVHGIMHRYSISNGEKCVLMVTKLLIVHKPAWQQACSCELPHNRPTRITVELIQHHFNILPTYHMLCLPRFFKLSQAAAAISTPVTSGENVRTVPAQLGKPSTDTRYLRNIHICCRIDEVLRAYARSLTLNSAASLRSARCRVL